MISKEKFHKDLGKRIREIREKKGISLRDFETYDDSLDRSNLSKIENGQKAATTYNLYRIAQVLGVDLAEFFK